MDAPVEGKLEGPPVEASASRSVAGYGGRRGGLAHRTWTRELMATRRGVFASAVNGESVGCGRNACRLGSVPRLFRSCEVGRSVRRL
jgi:hypothetical protein